MSFTKRLFEFLLAALLINCAVNTQASLEFIRVEGALTQFGAQQLGLDVDQSLYFDVAIDTDVVLEYQFDYWIEYFAEGLGGTVNNTPINAVSAMDASTNFYRFITFEFDDIPAINRLYLGERFPCYNDYAEPQCQDPLAFDWEVGDTLELTSGQDFGNPDFFAFAYMEVTYRGAEPPPPVPLPASLWLLMSGLTCLLASKRKHRNTG